jgi:hypothetical protein
MKTLTNFGDFTGSRIRISNSGSTSKRIASIQPLKKPTANHLPVILKMNTETRVKFVWLFHHHLRLTEQFTESQVASWMPQQAFLRGF